LSTFVSEEPDVDVRQARIPLVRHEDIPQRRRAAGRQGPRPWPADHRAIRCGQQQRSRDSAEFWQLQAAATKITAEETVERLFPDHPSVQADALPVSARWFVRNVKSMHANQLLELVRIVDNAMNNTSLILLFQIGQKLFLFPGDAQIENREYALRAAPDSAAKRKLLSAVSLYKVGHHGSLNATPKSLWKLFKKKPKFIAMMSTRPGKHGDKRAHTEVPRQTLVDELEAHSEVQVTTTLKGENALFEDVKVRFELGWGRGGGIEAESMLRGRGVIAIPPRFGSHLEHTRPRLLQVVWPAQAWENLIFVPPIFSEIVFIPTS